MANPNLIPPPYFITTKRINWPLLSLFVMNIVEKGRHSNHPEKAVDLYVGGAGPGRACSLHIM
jgi:hypothetical protein